MVRRGRIAERGWRAAAVTNPMPILGQGPSAPAPTEQEKSAMAEDRQMSGMTFMTVAEVASVMRVSKMTVYRLVHSGELPAVRVGRSFRVPQQAVDEFLGDSYHGTA